VLGDLRWYARHVRGAPHEHIGIHTKKVDEHDFLFDVEGGADPQRSAVGVGGVDRDELDGLCGLKSPGMMLGVERLTTESVEVDDEGLGLYDSLGVLDALDIAVVCMIIRGLDSDDAVGARHLELEVRVVRERHELSVARPPQDGVVRSLKPNHLEGEDLLAVVGGSTKADGQVDAPEGPRAFPRHNAVERRGVAPELRLVELQEL